MLGCRRAAGGRLEPTPCPLTGSQSECWGLRYLGGGGRRKQKQLPVLPIRMQGEKVGDGGCMQKGEAMGFKWGTRGFCGIPTRSQEHRDEAIRAVLGAAGHPLSVG